MYEIKPFLAMNFKVVYPIWASLSRHSPADSTIYEEVLLSFRENLTIPLQAYPFPTKFSFLDKISFPDSYTTLMPSLPQKIPRN